MCRLYKIKTRQSLIKINNILEYQSLAKDSIEKNKDNHDQGDCIMAACMQPPRVLYVRVSSLPDTYTQCVCVCVWYFMAH